MNKYDAWDIYAEYEYQDNSRQAHRFNDAGRKRRQAAEVRTTLADISDNIQDWVPTYAQSLDPKHHERQWVIESAGPFYRQALISDITRVVKAGKEANVYTCLATPQTGHNLLAAKLYRPRMLRHLKNDAVYKAGRDLVNSEGKLLKGRRERAALRKKSDFGKKLDIEWWIGNEYRGQQMLYEAGANVPQPLAFAGTAILMEYIGDDYMAAPLLNDVTLTHTEADSLFRQVMDNVALMLDLHLVHGDLSAYNILYWHGRITIIDFPQLVDARQNPNAFMLLQRDIQRVCDYFTQFGLTADPAQLALDLWQPYMGL
jgi:RIO kinase 1